MDKKDNKQISIFNITISPTDRTYKGIKDWRNALQSAENIINPRRRLLYDLYEEITLDPHLSAVMEKRRQNVLTTEVKFFNPSGKVDLTIEKLISQPFFNDMISDIIDSRGWGHSLLFFDKISIEQKSSYELIPRKHVVPERGIVINNAYDTEGTPFNMPPYSNYCIGVGKPKDLGLLLKAAPYVIYKKGDVADWATYAEIFGSPLRKATYDGNDLETKKELESTMKNSANASYVIYPKQAEIEFIESQSKSGSSDLYAKLADFCDKQNSKLFLGNTMTTDAEGGNYKGEVHEKSEERITEADRRLVLAVLNTSFIDVLENFGIKARGGWFAFDDPDELTLEDYAKIKSELQLDIDDSFFYEKWNIPEPSVKRKVEKKDEGGREEPGDEQKLHDHHHHHNPSQGWFKKMLREFSSFFFSKKISLSDKVNSLYGTVDLSDGALSFLSIDELINNSLTNIFSGMTPPGGVDPGLWQLTNKELNKAVDEAFAGVKFGDPNFDFTEQLKVNNGVFSAFKTHEQVNELVGSLVDEKGNLKGFSAFKQDAQAIIGKYNKVWLETEYATAVRSARSASLWKGFERDRHLYPNLTYLPSRAAEPRPEHEVFYGTTLPMEHPWWATHTPPLDWNCMCGITNSDKEATGVPGEGVEPAPGLDNNPGTTGRLFSKTHPYEAGLKQQAKTNLSRQAMRIERKLIQTWALKNIAGKQYKTKAGQVRLSGKGIRETLNQNHDNYLYKNRLLLSMADVLEQADVYKVVMLNGTEIKAYHYLSVNLQGEVSYLVIREYQNGQKALYSIVDKLKGD